MSLMNPKTLIMAFLTLIIVVTMVTELIPEANTTLDNFTTENPDVPLGGFFEGNGLIILGIMAALVLGVFAIVGFAGGKK